MNHVYSTANHPIPQIGMGATILSWSDRRAATIIAMTPKTVTVQEDISTRTDNNGMSESQEYAYTVDPTGPRYTFRLTKRGWRCSGYGLAIGARRTYHDYSF